MFERNRNPAGRLFAIRMGIAELVDGVVRILSLGFLYTTLPIATTRVMARVAIANMKKAAKRERVQKADISTEEFIKQNDIEYETGKHQVV